MRQAQLLHVFQVALGGGNPNQHPQFSEILRITRAKYGIVPNYTTNGRGLTEAVVEATGKYCGAVAVSAYPPYRETGKRLNRAVKRNNANIHFILTSRVWTLQLNGSNSSGFLKRANAIVFLNYKPVGRFADEGLLLNKSPRIEEFLSSLQWGRGVSVLA